MWTGKILLLILYNILYEGDFGNNYGERKDLKITSAASDPVTRELALGGYMNKKEFPYIWFLKIMQVIIFLKEKSALNH